VMTVVAAVCCMAARGDRVQVSGVELRELELGARPANAGQGVSRTTTADAPRTGSRTAAEAPSSAIAA
jgi:hypothetical protein